MDASLVIENVSRRQLAIYKSKMYYTQFYKKIFKYVKNIGSMMVRLRNRPTVLCFHSSTFIMVAGWLPPAHHTRVKLHLQWRRRKLVSGHARLLNFQENKWKETRRRRFRRVAKATHCESFPRAPHTYTLTKEKPLRQTCARSFHI